MTKAGAGLVKLPAINKQLFILVAQFVIFGPVIGAVTTLIIFPISIVMLFFAPLGFVYLTFILGAIPATLTAFLIYRRLTKGKTISGRRYSIYGGILSFIFINNVIFWDLLSDFYWFGRFRSFEVTALGIYITICSFFVGFAATFIMLALTGGRQRKILEHSSSHSRVEKTL